MTTTENHVAIGKRRIGEGEPCFIVAEVASAHQGESVQALALARTAKEAGADAVKFQLFRASELIAPNDPRLSTFQQIELGLEEWERILEETRGFGLSVLADVFDRTSLALAEKHRVAGYKIHSTDMEHPEFIRAVAATGKPLMLSTGGSGLGAVESAITVAKREGNHQIVLLHGVQNFPTRVEDSHLSFLDTLRSAFGLPVGFLDHVSGDSAMATLFPALAVSCGAELVEKHITLDRSTKGFDYESSLGPADFRTMVALVRDTERALGSQSVPQGSSAERYHRLMRRAVMSGEPLPKGEPIRKEQLAFLRSEIGLSPFEAPKLVGRRPRNDIPAWEPLTEDLFE